MSAAKKLRIVIDSLVFFGVIIPVAWVSETWWLPALVVVFGIWNFYDGQTRPRL